jgi:GxxExxY protein
MKNDQVAEWSRQVIEAAKQVHQELGPGWPEGAYEEALAREMHERQIPYRRQVYVETLYKGTRVFESLIDFVVADALVVEIAPVQPVRREPPRLVVAHLRAAGLEHGLLLDFCTCRLEDEGVRSFVVGKDVVELGDDVVDGLTG